MRNLLAKYRANIILNFILIIGLLACVITICFFIGINYAFSPSQIFKSTINSVVELKAETSNIGTVFGTATFVDKKGTLVSNAHLVTYKDGGSYSYHQSISVRFYEESDYYSVNLVDYDVINDLCVLSFADSFDVHEFEPINFINNAGIEAGDTIYAVGNAMNHGLSIVQGIVSIPLIDIAIDEVTYRVIQCDLTINRGNSGGPLLDKKGNFIGITTFRIRDNSGDIIYGIAFAIPSTIVEAYINKNIN